VGAVNILDMDKKEREELLSIVLPNWNESVNKSFHPSNINFAIFANTAPHLHAHFIPRYREVVKFSDIEFIDVNPDGNYAPYPKRKLAESVMESIKHELVRGF
jgi:diadenosine tetraphosphate (Ap4A) HIT family hydrolase